MTGGFVIRHNRSGYYLTAERDSIGPVWSPDLADACSWPTYGDAVLRTSRFRNGHRFHVLEVDAGEVQS